MLVKPKKNVEKAAHSRDLRGLRVVSNLEKTVEYTNLITRIVSAH